MPAVTFDGTLYLVTDFSLSLGRSLVEVVRASVAGGVTCVQLREKEISTRDFVILGRAVKAALAGSGVPLIINDRADVALAVEAEGLHIGQSDLSYPDARRLMGPGAIIGLSVETSEQAREALRWQPDYVAASPVFSTPTKTDTASALGLEGVGEIRNIVGPVVPLIAIGGLHADNIAGVIRAGADGVAVVSALCSAPDPMRAAQRLKAIIETAKKG